MEVLNLNLDPDLNLPFCVESCISCIVKIVLGKSIYGICERDE